VIRRIKLKIWATLSWLKWHSVMPIAVALGWLRKRRQIVSVWPEGEVALGPNIVLFMHFDRKGGVRRQLLDYMRELTANGRSVVLVTNSKKLRPEAMAALQGICAAVMIRRNIGYDFGAWADAIHYFGLPRAGTQELILANDSVFGPLTPLKDVLGRLDYDKADIWGLTESWQVRYHLQSFFLAFGPTALRSPVFAKFWGSVRPVPAKAYIVRTYEIGVTQAMIKGGLHCEALWPYESLLRKVDTASFEALIKETETTAGKVDPILRNRKLQILRLRDAVARRVALNPTADLWRHLLLAGFPFIKRELLRDNPTFVEDVGDWVAIVREVVGADPEPILLDLRTMLKDQAP
jgi:hypothetical protein